jgi:hypothetical protein
MEDELLRMIARQIGKDKRVSDTSKWMISHLARAGEVNRQALMIIDSYAGGVDAECAEAILAAAEGEVGTLDEAMLSLLSEKGEMTEDVQQALDAFTRQGRQELAVQDARIAEPYAQALTERCNMVNTVMGYSAVSAYNNAVREIARNAGEIDRSAVLREMNAGAASVVMGTESIQQATRQTIHRMAEKGLPGFVDKAGRQWSPEAYVRMDLRTTMGNTARAAQDARCDEWGIQLIEVSSHNGARPKCAPYQGRIFSRDGSRGVTRDLGGNQIEYIPLSETSYGEPDGLFGINCGHQQYPFIPGASVRRYYPYPEEENAEHYRELQGQRAMERKIRADKRECMMLQETGDEEGLRKAAGQLKADRQKYAAYSEAHGLGVHGDRTQVYGYDRSKSMKTVWAGRTNGSGTVGNAADSTGVGVHYAKGSLCFDRNVGEKPPTDAMQKALNDEYEKFCGIFGKIDTVSSISIEAYRGGHEYGGYNPNSSVLTLLGAGGDDGMAFLTKTTKEHHKIGDWSTKNPMHTFRHELGHAWQKQLKATDRGYDAKISKIEQKKKDFWNTLTSRSDYATMDEKTKKKEMGKILSAYGLKEANDIDELISECVAEYVNGKPRAFAREVIEILMG